MPMPDPIVAVAATPLAVAIASRALVAGTPLLLGTLGEIYAERAGVMNLGVEGMMAVGAMTGFAAALATGSPWLGLVAAMAAGMVLALLHGLATVCLRANQVVSGLALTTLGLGLAGLFGKGFVGTPLTAKFTTVRIPGLADLPWLGEVLFARDPVFYLSVVLGIALAYIMYYTRWGLVLRAVGENPLAAETMGVNVTVVRLLAVAFGGAMAGAAGAYLSLCYIPSWIEGMTAGRGWIIVALTIFAGWNPWRAFVGAWLFGAIEVGQYFLQPLQVSPNLLLMLPYLATLAALIIGSMLRGPGRGSGAPAAGGPAALGEPYTRGERH